MPAPPRTTRTATSLLAALTALLALALVTCGPAAAHPFGDPQTVTVGLRSADVVRVHWQVGMDDDLTYLAQDLDLLPPGRVMLDGAVVYQPSDPDLLGRSPRFARYLLQHLQVTSGGQDCRGTVGRLTDVRAGADVDFRCPHPVSTATVAVSTLTDMSSLYSTLATGPGGQRAVYDGGHATHRWTFDPAAAPAGGGTGSSAVVQLGLVGAGLALATAVGVVVVHRRRAGPGGVPATAELPVPVGHGRA